VMDHFYQLPMLGKPDQPMFEAYTLLTALAARTRTVKLGAMVGGVTYRNPAVLAKTVSCLDVISKGRAIWGIGAAWFELEHEAYGYEFGTFTQRFEKLEEAVQIAQSMFVNETTTFDGQWYQVKDAFNLPKPIQAGGPPTLIGGSGERKTLRLVAQYANACNVFGDPTAVAHLMTVLDGHCETFGRNPSDICRTTLATVVAGRTMEAARATIAARLGAGRWEDLGDEVHAQVEGAMIIGDPDTVGAKVRAYLDAGLDGMICNIPESGDLEAVAFTGSVLRPLLRP